MEISNIWKFKSSNWLHLSCFCILWVFLEPGLFLAESYRTSRKLAVATSLEVFRCCFLCRGLSTRMIPITRPSCPLTIGIYMNWQNEGEKIIPQSIQETQNPCHAAMPFLLHHSLPVSRLRPPPLWHSRKLKAAVSACRQEHTGAIGFESGYQFTYSLERSYSKSMLKVC